MFSLGKKAPSTQTSDWVSEATDTIERVIDGIRHHRCYRGSRGPRYCCRSIARHLLGQDPRNF
jgi:hypothetical protein